MSEAPPSTVTAVGGELDPREMESLEPAQAFALFVRDGAKKRASDLFILCEEKSSVLALRRWGQMIKIAHVSRDQGRHLINHVKTAAGMDIAERRRPSDGRLIQQLENCTLDLRVSCIPTLYGEDMTLRVLDRSASLLPIDKLGMSQQQRNAISSMLNSPSGLVLVTGPTGTGKTTTLYAFLQYLNDGSRKINTLEDPVEYAVAGIRQTQVAPKLGVNFSDLLPSILRQAPDVIMVGEIRDQETAATAVRAANSGHLVLATLHAPVAASAVQSMLALGAPPFFFASCLLGVVAQRLIRVLDPDSRVGYDMSEAPGTFADIDDLMEPGEGKVIYGPGRSDENPDGFSGQAGLFELMTMNSELRRLVAETAPRDVIQQKAIEAGMIEFRRGALLKVARGISSIEEMMRVVPSEVLGLDG